MSRTGGTVVVPEGLDGAAALLCLEVTLKALLDVLALIVFLRRVCLWKYGSPMVS
jgi:hypothetical protein